MADVAISPNDPLFMLHHAYIDYEWWQWQVENPQLAMQYDGFDDTAGRTVHSNDQMPPYNERVRTAIAPDALCVQYQPPVAITRMFR